ncbi:MAG: hypothetical protein ACK55Z_33755, partial [bacterium]
MFAVEVKNTFGQRIAQASKLLRGADFDIRKITGQLVKGCHSQLVQDAPRLLHQRIVVRLRLVLDQERILRRFQRLCIAHRVSHVLPARAPLGGGAAITHAPAPVPVPV